MQTPQIKYGGMIVSLMRRPRFTAQKHLFSVSGTYFCYRLMQQDGDK
jgi:hypothetical protein